MPPVTPAPTPVLDHLLQWSDRLPSEFPRHAPPCDALGDSAADRVLAAAFRSLALEPSEGRRLVHISTLVKIHSRRVQGALNARPDRYPELRPWLTMVLVLSSWDLSLQFARVPS